ncbi:MAG: nickel-dependent lactate racemase [Eubacteriales bacterium]|nr:nickel-dependent lactate racemase [Eubacteriales bacterium]
MQKISVPYGKGLQEAYVDDNVLIEFINYEKKILNDNEESMLKHALDSPIGSKPLEEMISEDEKVLIVVNDQTRPGPNQLIVEELTKRLLTKIKKDQITFIIATGSHRVPTKEELINILGEAVVKEYNIIQHECQNDESLVYFGESLHDVPIYINKALTECSFCIVTGLIAPHHAAGYSGGRKSIVPGLAGFKTLKIHHSLPIRPFEPAMGMIYGNPFHEVALDVALKTKTRFMVNAVQNPQKQNIAFVAGDLIEAHRKGVDRCKEASEVYLKERADIVVVSPGGYPRDRNLYQAQKALSVAETIGNPECTFILVAEAKDGYGEGVLREWLTEAQSPEEVIERFRLEGYDIGSNKAFMFARAMTKGKVVIVSEYLDEAELNGMMLGHAESLQQAMDEAIKIKMPNKVLVLPNAVNIIPKIKLV